MSEENSYANQNLQNPPSHGQKKRKSKWWIPVVIILGVLFAGLTIIVLGFFALFGSAFQTKEVSIKPNSVLRLRLSGTVEEIKGTHPLDFLISGGGKNVKFLDILLAIKRAKTDRNIKGIYLRSGDLHAGFAKATEIRNALIDFKKSGKFIYAFVEVGSEKDYYLASVADSIFMPTEGLLELNGFAFEEFFWKNTYEKLGINFYVQQFEEYKSAGEPYVRTRFSKQARENLHDLLMHYYDTFVSAVAASRHLSPDDVAEALDRGIYTADTLKALGFIDGIIYESDAFNLLKRKIYSDTSADLRSKKLRMISLPTYVASRSFRKQKAPVYTDKEIAIVFGSGIIISGDTGDEGLEQSLIASQTFIRNLHRAAENKKVKAIIIRIDSPGGSVVAADAIWREIRKAAKEKPVYASMSDVAASGGYYMAMACDTIIAYPNTITGSIGVISIIPNFSGTLDKIGASVDTIAIGKSSLFLNPFLPLTEYDKKKLYTISENMYKRFVGRVAESRDMTFEEARALAKGRVWTGDDAFKIGLVDTLGGLQTAIRLAKRRLGIPKDKLVRIRIYPEPGDSFSAFINFLRRFIGRAQPSLQAESLMRSPFMDILPERARKQILYRLLLARLTSKEKVIAALPYTLAIE